MNAFILAGGRSTRMGHDKARLLLNGRPLVAHAVALVRSLGLEPRICGARPDLGELAAVIADRHRGCGPIGGIEAALAASNCDLNLFLPVDVPDLPAAFLRWLIERAEQSRAAATIPRLGDRPQPLCAVYHRALLPGIEAAIEDGRYRIFRAISEAAAALGEAVDLFQIEAIGAALPAGCWPAEPPPRLWFRNVNTPEDYRLLRFDPSHASGANGGHPIS